MYFRQFNFSFSITFDKYLLFTLLILVVLGLLMVYSSSSIISYKTYGHPFHFVIRQLVYLCIGFMLMLVVQTIPMQAWQKLALFILFTAILLLGMVLIPGLGRQVNGSMRWLGTGILGIQVSELAKLAVILYIPDYLVRHVHPIRHDVQAFLRPLFLLGIMAILLLKEPDFGATTVIMGTALGVMFLAGMQVWQFGLLFAFMASALGILAISSPYRMARLMTFLHPWANPFDSGYQLTQALIAFGRGGWFGLGLGASIQKLFYLPEAHTDFLIAVLAEELGLIGVFIVMGLFAIIIGRALYLGRIAYLKQEYFSAYVAYGISLWLAIQTTINIGVNAGILPTKGLTLPLMSYGGSSILMACVAMGLLLRIHYEISGIHLKLQTKILPSLKSFKFFKT